MTTELQTKVMMLRWLALAVIVITLILLYKFYKMAKAKGYSGFISFVISIISGSLFLFVLYAGITLWDGAWMSKRTYTKLCKTSSKNEVYDQEALKRYHNAIAVYRNDWGGLDSNKNSPLYEEGIKLYENKDKSKIEAILQSLGENYNDFSENGYSYQYWQNSKFLIARYSFSKVDECKNKDCFKDETRLYDLGANKLVAYFIDFKGSKGKIVSNLSPNESRYSDSCSILGIGAFKKSKRKILEI